MASSLGHGTCDGRGWRTQRPGRGMSTSQHLWVIRENGWDQGLEGGTGLGSRGGDERGAGVSCGGKRRGAAPY